MSRMRVGEWVAAVGGVGLFVLLFFNWFEIDVKSLPQPTGGGVLNLLYTFKSTSADGWSSLGWFMVFLLCVLLVGAAALTYMTLKRASPAWPVGAAVLTWIVGSLIWLVLLVRVCIAQPGPDQYVVVQAPAYLGLAFAFLIPLGGLLSLRDERTHSAEAQAYMPPPARTAPGT
ncbi:MAG TPA: hypothetical protein VI318_05805 [Baekduia sp.]